MVKGLLGRGRAWEAIDSMPGRCPTGPLSRPAEDRIIKSWEQTPRCAPLQRRSKLVRRRQNRIRVRGRGRGSAVPSSDTGGSHRPPAHRHRRMTGADMAVDQDAQNGAALRACHLGWRGGAGARAGGVAWVDRKARLCGMRRHEGSPVGERSLDAFTLGCLTRRLPVRDARGGREGGSLRSSPE